MESSPEQQPMLSMGLEPSFADLEDTPMFMHTVCLWKVGVARPHSSRGGWGRSLAFAGPAHIWR
jgi:hypothetical protein